jgi:hypothetical protein
VVVVPRLALLSQETVGLDAVLEAVELWQDVSIIAQWRSRHRRLPPPFRAWALRRDAQRVLVADLPPSRSLRSGNRPGRLDAYKVSINK